MQNFWYILYIPFMNKNLWISRHPVKQEVPGFYHLILGSDLITKVCHEILICKFSSFSWWSHYIFFYLKKNAFLMLLVVFRKPENRVTQKCSVIGLSSFSLLNNSTFSLIQHNFNNMSCHVQIAGAGEQFCRLILSILCSCATLT